MPAINSIRKSKHLPSWPRFSIIPSPWPFHVVVWQKTATKFTKIYNARAQPLFCSIHLLFSDVPVALAVVVCLSFPNDQLSKVTKFFHTVTETPLNQPPLLRGRGNLIGLPDKDVSIVFTLLNGPPKFLNFELTLFWKS